MQVNGPGRSLMQNCSWFPQGRAESLALASFRGFLGRSLYIVDPNYSSFE